MTWMNVAAMFIWTGASAVLLVVLMFIDSFFTKYKDVHEMKSGNIAVTTRFVMKLFAQGYILSQAISRSNSLWEALIASVVSFFILLIIEWLVRIFLQITNQLDLDQGTKDGKVAYALVAGSLHVVGALILGACL